MSKLVDLDNAAYATYNSIAGGNSNGPTRATQMHAPPSWLNGFHVEECDVVADTWKKPKQNTTASVNRERDEALFSSVSGEAVGERRETERLRREKMTKSSINLGFDYDGREEVGRKEQYKRDKMDDHTNHLWLADAKKKANKRFGAPDPVVTRENILKKSSVVFGYDGVDGNYDDDMRNAERWRSAARDGMVLKGVDGDVKKHREAAKKKKLILQSSSVGMKFGSDRVVYETEQERNLQATAAKRQSQEYRDFATENKKTPSHLVDSMGPLLQQSLSDYA